MSGINHVGGTKNRKELVCARNDMPVGCDRVLVTKGSREGEGVSLVTRLY